MPPKQAAVAKKGQTNLFSFFNKPSTKASVEVTATIESGSDGDSTPCYEAIKKRVDGVMNPGSAATSKADDSPFSAMSSQRSIESEDGNNDIRMCIDEAPLDYKRKLVAEDSNLIGRISIVERGTINSYIPIFLYKIQYLIARTTTSAASRAAKKSKSIIDDDEEDEWDEGANDKKGKGGDDSSASEEDDLADSSDEEEFDEESDDEQAVKKRRLKKGASKMDLKPNGVSTTRPPLAPGPVKTYASTPLQKANSLSQPQSSSIYDACSAQKVGNGVSPLNMSTPCSSSTQGSFTPNSGSSTPSTPFVPLLPEGVVGRGSHEHNHFSFLLPGERKDKNQHRPDHPQYNPRSCHVPPSFLKEQTPGMAQWWILKQDNMDTVLFFKVNIIILVAFSTRKIKKVNICVKGHLFLNYFVII